MEPRDVLDGLLVALLGGVLYLRVIRPSLSGERFDTLAGFLLNLDTVVYLVVAAVFGVVFVGYIAVYLPRKQSREF
jgi:hypothetical protein